ncbi:MAG: hypothetical protein PHQ76_06565 [Caldisericia bacterium]|nr:hypothetical protein [Caldisericia bacterium]
MKSLIIGKGEVGSALFKVLKKHYPTFIRDKKDLKVDNIEVIHICFPYSKNFIKDVKKYQKEYKPKYTIIHSTVPVGTSRKLKAYHSPVRGVHPNLEKGIKTFVKYLAPDNKELKRYFKKAGIKVKTFNKQETTELAKILDTTYYGWNIVFCKEVKRICDKYGLNFNDVYTEFNKTYNEGYIKLGKKNVVRPVLKPIEGKIGGHCIIQNCFLLKDKITKLILNFNKRY